MFQRHRKQTFKRVQLPAFPTKQEVHSQKFKFIKS